MARIACNPGWLSARSPAQADASTRARSCRCTWSPERIHPAMRASPESWTAPAANTSPAKVASPEKLASPPTTSTPWPCPPITSSEPATTMTGKWVPQRPAGLMGVPHLPVAAAGHPLSMSTRPWPPATPVVTSASSTRSSSDKAPRLSNGGFRSTGKRRLRAGSSAAAAGTQRALAATPSTREDGLRHGQVRRAIRRTPGQRQGRDAVADDRSRVRHQDVGRKRDRGRQGRESGAGIERPGQPPRSHTRRATR